jgi:nicotinate-nucleotide adenylyltransferase
VRKIGIYGGTFDPIHHGHLILARETLEKFNLARIVFVPAAISPHKHTPPASGELRLDMLRAAIAGEAEFEISTYELLRPPPSYTIETVEHCRAQYPDTQLYLLVGDDNVSGLPTWRRFEELREIVTIIVLRRAERPVAHEYLSVKRQIDISATEIRDRVAIGRSIRYFVPSEVEEIISREKLYQEVIQ